MASHYIASYTLITNRGGAYAPSKIVNVNWNDVSEAIEVYVADDIFSAGVLQASGPSLGSLNIDYFQTNYNYNFCDGTTFNYFTLTAYIFPYAQQEFIPDSFACSIVIPPTCDLQIADNPIIVEASNASANDGSITVSATSSNGVIKFALFDFNYATEGQTSGLFEDLYGTEYTIYAKDEAGCIDTITVTVPISEVYNLRYFMEFTDIHGGGGGLNHKIEIHERGYDGADEELLAAGDPFSKRLNSDAEDKFFIIRATDITFRFVSQVSFQYHGLFTEDERQFLVKHYIDYGSGYELDWSGYLVPFLYSENYVDPVYVITASATDGLASLKNIDFVDSSGNNLRGMMSGINIISLMIAKLDLDINIQSGLNIYDQNFNTTAADDPLAQAFYDTTLYYDDNGTPEKCDVVLKNILVDYLAVIAQSDNKWIIWRPEELISDFDYREFDSNGTYTSNGNIDPLVVLDVPHGTTDRIAWKDRSGVLGLLQSYGKFIIRQNLVKKESLLLSYNFEEEDVRPFVGNTYFFYGWSIIIEEGSVSWGLQPVQREGSSGAMAINFSNTEYSRALVYTLNSALSFSDIDDVLLFSFDYLIDTSYKLPWVRVKYKLKVGDYYYTDNRFTAVNLWSLTDPGYLELYLDKYNKFETFEKRIRLHGAGTPTSGGGAIELYLLFDNQADFDHDSLTDFRAAPTTTIIGSPLADYRRIVKDGSVVYRYYNYDLVFGVDTPPDVIVPDDFGGFQGVWNLTDSFEIVSNPNYTTEIPPIESILLDKMILRVLPHGNEPPESIDYSVNINTSNKNTLVVETFHGDYPITISNGQYAYKNPIKRYDTGFYYPTFEWARDGFSESNVIQQIMLKTLIAQFRKASRRLTGSVVGDIYLKPYNVVDDQSQDGRKYLVQGFDQQGRINEYNIDLYEIKNVADEDGGGSAFSGAYNPPEFGAQFDTGA